MLSRAFTTFPELETKRTRLSRIFLSDVSDFLDIYMDRVKNSSTGSETDLKTATVDKEQVLGYLRSWEDDYNNAVQISWGIRLKESNKFVGRIYLCNIVGNEASGYKVEIGYYISPTYWNCGYATEAVGEIVRYGFSAMNIKRFQAEILPENTASIRVCQKAGFINEGTLYNYAFYNIYENSLKTIVMMAITK